MTIMELKEKINKSPKLDGLYIFTGDEPIILNAYINMIIKKSGYKEKHFNSIKTVYNQLKSKSLLCENNCVFIIRDDKEFVGWTETDWSKINDNLIKNNIIILVCDNLSKSSKFYKHFQTHITIFDKLNIDILAKYVQKELPGLNIEYAKELVTICENMYSRILLECDKLKHLLQALKLSNFNDCYLYAMDNSFIWIPPEDAIFSFVDACLNRNISDCYYYLEECKRINENELNILSNLYTKFRALLQVQVVGYSKNITDITGLQYYQVKQVSNFVNRYSTEELLRALRLIHYCELCIKRGDMEASMTIDYMLVNLL